MWKSENLTPLAAKAASHLLPPREEDISKRKAKKTSHADMMVVNMCLLTHSLTHTLTHSLTHARTHSHTHTITHVH